MRKYVSLGSAMMMGVVLGKERPSYELKGAHHSKATLSMPLDHVKLEPAQRLTEEPPNAIVVKKGPRYQVELSPVTSVAASDEAAAIFAKYHNA